MSSRRCHPLIIAALVVIVTTSATTYGTADVSTGESVIEDRIENEDFDDRAITARVSSDGRFEWQDSQDQGSVMPCRQGYPPNHRHRNYHRHQHRHGGPPRHGGGPMCSGHHSHGRMMGGGCRFRHRQRYLSRIGSRTEAENMTTTDERLAGECERMDARFAADTAGLTRDERITRFVTYKMNTLGVTDEELRQRVTSMVRRRYDEMYRCCDKVDSEEKLECIKQTKSALFERICNGDEPICPWMLLRNSTRPSRQPSQQQQQQRPNVTSSCCPLQDSSERLNCYVNGIAAHRRWWRARQAQNSETETMVGRPRYMRRRRILFSSRMGRRN